MTEAMMRARCQVRSETESPCPQPAVLEIWGVAFCGACAREQEAYFAIGELVAQQERQGLRGRPLAEALGRMWREQRAGGKEGMGAEAHRGLWGACETRPLAPSNG